MCWVLVKMLCNMCSLCLFICVCWNSLCSLSMIVVGVWFLWKLMLFSICVRCLQKCFIFFVLVGGFLCSGGVLGVLLLSSVRCSLQVIICIVWERLSELKFFMLGMCIMVWQCVSFLFFSLVCLLLNIYVICLLWVVVVSVCVMFFCGFSLGRLMLCWCVESLSVKVLLVSVLIRLLCIGVVFSMLLVLVVSVEVLVFGKWCGVIRFSWVKFMVWIVCVVLLMLFGCEVCISMKWNSGVRLRVDMVWVLESGNSCLGQFSGF